MRLPLIADYAPERIIAWRGARAVTQQEFLCQAVALAQRLPDGRAAINLCDDRYRFMLTFAALCLRGQTSLLPPSTAPEVIAAIASAHAGCYIAADTPQPQSPCRVWAFEEAEASAPVASVPLLEGDQVVALAYTSGSTGQPKPHAKTWRTLVQTAQLSAPRLMGAAAGVAIVGTVPAQHMYGLEFTVMLALAAGHAAALARPFFPRDVADTLAALPPPRALVTTPVHLRACLNAGIALPALHRIVSATAPLDAEQAARIEQAFDTELHEIYGCTEGGSLAARRTRQHEVWQLHHGMRIEPRGDQHAWIHAAHLAEALAVDDRLDILGHDSFRLLGRDSDLLKVAGKRASLSDMSAKLLAIPGVLDAAVLLPDAADGKEPRPAALVVAPSLHESAILARLAESFDAVLLPRPLLRVDRLPRNALGKLPRAELLALLERAHG